MDQRIKKHLERLVQPSMDRLQHRAMVLDELREMEAEKVLPILRRFLSDYDGEIRCEAATLLLLLGGASELSCVVGLFDDREDWVRYHVVGLMDNFGNESIIDALSKVLKSDSDPGVRGQAAFALGKIGSPRSIPSLLDSLERDHELDQLGYSPSFVAATALDEILGTNHTRIKISATLCKLPPWPPDLEVVKRLASECYAAFERQRDEKK
jgi:HEAT repeat protein